MKRVLILLFCITISYNANADRSYDSLLVKLNSVLEQKNRIDAKKLKRIDGLKRQLSTSTNLDPTLRYNIYLKLYNEYKSFNYRQAFYYAQQLQQMGRVMHDPVKVAYSKVKVGFILLSSGMFKETFDSLKTIQANLLPDSIRKEYYFLTARAYYDLADFDRDSLYTILYHQRAEQYIDSAATFVNPRSFESVYFTGLRYLKAGNTPKATVELQRLMNSYKLNDREYAVTASTLSDIYIRTAKKDSAICLLILAAIADIKSATKEATAMLTLSQLLYQNGDIEKAYIYSKQAMEDAAYYGARQRELQVGAILPVIAAERINSVENQRRALFFYAALLTLLIVIIIVFAVIIYKQLRKLRIADEVIKEANVNLQQTIRQLNEAERIKEEYIGYYVNLISEYISKLDNFKRSVDTKLAAKRYDEIRLLVDNINLNQEREQLFVNFDRAFLKLFPHFVTDYNALFIEENQVNLLPSQLLNTDLRIFALVRLGISDPVKIANILSYSVNTIYNYKTRIKSRSKVENDAFELAIMAINSV